MLAGERCIGCGATNDMPLSAVVVEPRCRIASCFIKRKTGREKLPVFPETRSPAQPHCHSPGASGCRGVRERCD